MTRRLSAQMRWDGRLYMLEDEMSIIRRGEIYYAKLSPVVGSEQNGIRPVVILQNDIGNRFSPTTIVAAITSKKMKADLPTHVKIHVDGLKNESFVLLEQIRTIDKMRLRERIGKIDQNGMKRIDNALMASFGIKFDDLKIENNEKASENLEESTEQEFSIQRMA